MSSMIKTPRKAGAAKPRHNPARAINDRDWRRKQMAEFGASRASSTAGSPPPPSIAASAVSRSQSQCANPRCTSPNVVDGTCHSCGFVMAEDSQIVADVQFGEASNGQAYAMGTTVAHGEAGPRMNAAFAGRRPIAGGGNGDNNLNTMRRAAEIIDALASRFHDVLRAYIANMAKERFKLVQARGFLRGRAIERVAGVCLYFAIRQDGNTPLMLIDIADALALDVFVLGRTFKRMLTMFFDKDEHGNIINCPFEPVFPEDIIKSLASRLGFHHDTPKVQEDAVRIVQRMDRDWIVLGRKPAGICGSALIIAARMNNFRRTPLEVSYVAKVTQATLKLRLDEFAIVESAQMSIADFTSEENHLRPESHDPPAFYRQKKEYQDQLQKKKGSRKHKRASASAEEIEQPDDTAGGQGQKRQRTENENENAGAQNSTQPAAPLQKDAEGFVIPPLPERSQPRASNSTAENENITEDDISEAYPEDVQDEEDALASKYGDVPLPHSGGNPTRGQTSSLAPGAKTIRKGRVQGSSLKEPTYLDNEEWTAAEQNEANEILDKIKNTESDVWIAASAYAGVRRQELLEKLASSRPITYRDNTLIDEPEVTEEEFADDPEVINCLLTEEERKIKEQLWLNDNKDWLREQQEKEYKAKMAPPKKPRKHNRKPRIGEGQLTPASSASDAAMATAKRLIPSSRINLSAIGNMLKWAKGPGSQIGSEITSQQTSRAGSEDIDDADSDEPGDEPGGNEEGADEEEGHEGVEDYDESQYNNEYDDEFGGGDDY